MDISIANIGGKLAQTLVRLAKIIGPMVSAIMSFVFMILISLHMSLSAEKINHAYPKLIPPAYRSEISDLISRILGVWSAFLRGQLTLMVVMGFLVFLLNLVLGTPQAVFLGLIAGVLEIIPSLGPFLATIPAVALVLVFGSSWLNISPLWFTLIVIQGYILLSGLENQLLVLRIMGGAVDLPPLVVIVGVTIGGAAFGLLGIFLATSMISTGKEIFGYYIIRF